MAATTRMKGSVGRTRILFVLDQFADPHAGTERQFWMLYRGLDRARFDPKIVLLRRSGFLEKSLPWEPPVTLEVERLSSIRALWKAVGLAIWARRHGFRLAHIFFNDGAMLLPAFLRVAGLKVIVSRRDLGFWYDRRVLQVLRIVGRFVTRVIANCEAVRKVVVRAEGIPERRICVIYNGAVRYDHRVAPASREALGIPVDAPLLVLVANLRALKRVGDAIEALAMLPVRLADTHLLIVGEDRIEEGISQEMALRRQAVERGVSKRVHFLGKCLDPYPVVAMANVCILCSETEGLSNAIIEYMAMAKPSVVTCVGGNLELQVDGITGFFMEVGDIRRLADRLLTLLSDRELRGRMGEEARRRVESMCSVQTMIEQHCSLYQDLTRPDG